MTAKFPSSSILQAVSTTTLKTGCYNASSSSYNHMNRATLSIFRLESQQRRRYAKQRSPPSPPTRNPIEAALPQYSFRSAFDQISNNQASDPINPPRSTLPPPLDLPERGRSENFLAHLFHLGRAYVGFYKNGLKSVWYNNKAAKQLQERISRQVSSREKMAEEAIAMELVTRSDYQLLLRNRHDIGKLPVFGVLVLLFGEWLPLIVPFIPSAVPMTSRIPKQVLDMRLKLEERRRRSFRRGITEPDTSSLMESASGEKADGTEQQQQQEESPEQAKARRLGLSPAANNHQWPIAHSPAHLSSLLRPLRADQLHHISTTLNLHSSLWDRVQLGPPASLLRGAITQRLGDLALDDILLIRAGGAARLSPEELLLACEARGLDVLGKPAEVLRHGLAWWLMRQEEDRGRGGAVLQMLFRRPNKW